MMNYVYDFLVQFIGTYVIQSQTVYLPVTAIDATHGTEYIASYQAYQQTAMGIASLDIPWLISAFFVLFIVYSFIYKPIWHVYKELTSIRGNKN